MVGQRHEDVPQDGGVTAKGEGSKKKEPVQRGPSVRCIRAVDASLHIALIARCLTICVQCTVPGYTK